MWNDLFRGYVNNIDERLSSPETGNNKQNAEKETESRYICRMLRNWEMN